MKLYESFLKTIYPNRQVYFDARCFMEYEIENDGSMFIYNCFSESFVNFIQILRFIEFKTPTKIFIRVQLKTVLTEKNINLFSKMGFKIYATDNDAIFMKVDFETWEKETKKYFNNNEGSEKVNNERSN